MADNNKPSDDSSHQTTSDNGNQSEKGSNAQAATRHTTPTANMKATAQDFNSATGKAADAPELDDFGLPITKYSAPSTPTSPAAAEHGRQSSNVAGRIASEAKPKQSTSELQSEEDLEGDEGTARSTTAIPSPIDTDTNNGDDEFKDANSRPTSRLSAKDVEEMPVPNDADVTEPHHSIETNPNSTTPSTILETTKSQVKHGPATGAQNDGSTTSQSAAEPQPVEDQAIAEAKKDIPKVEHNRNVSISSTTNGLGVAGVSEFSHQQLIKQDSHEEGKDDKDEWQVMPAYAPYDIYDDDNKLIAKEYDPNAEQETYGYAGLGGAGKGYTRVVLDDDAESVNSIDENTQYLFKEAGSTSLAEDEESQRDAVSQLQATKDLLTEGQRIAYVGLTRLEMSAMVKDVQALLENAKSRRTNKEVQIAVESIKMWSQKMMIRLYTHMEISQAEQVMIEQLSDHGVMPQDLTPVLMANARVKNPMAEKGHDTPTKGSGSGVTSPRSGSVRSSMRNDEVPASPPPAYDAQGDAELAGDVKLPSQMETTDRIDIDIRWTVLCDLFLVLIADSVYDARSRSLLERVGKALEISWLDICRFEKKVTDALEMQQNAEKENWNEDQHMENRRKMALKKRYVYMGLATVGGGLVIGLSAGLMAPLIGAGLAAGFTTIGVTGTGSFLAGVGGAAVITSSAAASGSVIGVRAANRRTGAVRTFEYRPLHNNKRVNLIVTVSGWMTGKVDDVRLPYSTVDPVMGDIYSVLWEPEMLTSMGDTINILATEALTQGLQQLLGSTILVSLMAALQLPVVLTKLSYLIDNPWAVSLDRATAAGLILADSLIDRNLGTRPITLVGYSLGSRVIFSCLLELARKGAYGLVQNVYMFGSPVVVKQDEWSRARSVVGGRFVNGYNRNDWILGYLFRLTNGGIRRVAGLGAIEAVPGIENMDLTEHVVGHMDYRTAMPRLLRECGWLVESDEFTEIEDPDPENHQERQRELINEIEEARKELAKGEKDGETKKGAFSFFSRKKKLKKQDWEVYEDTLKNQQQNQGGSGPSQAESGSGSGKTEDGLGNNHGVLFDVDAIRAELAKEAAENGGSKIAPADAELFQVREIKSTLPPMKLELSPSVTPPTPAIARNGPRDSLRETRSAEAVPPYRPSYEYRLSQDYMSSPSPQSSQERIPSRSRQVSHDRTSTFPPETKSTTNHSGSGYLATPLQQEPWAADEDEVQMTFDTSFTEEATPRPAPPPKDGSPSARPEMRSFQTVPNITLNDPWADEDDEEFGKEKEISMTFA